MASRGLQLVALSLAKEKSRRLAPELLVTASDKNIEQSTRRGSQEDPGIGQSMLVTNTASPNEEGATPIVADLFSSMTSNIDTTEDSDYEDLEGSTITAQENNAEFNSYEVEGSSLLIDVLNDGRNVYDEGAFALSSDRSHCSVSSDDVHEESSGDEWRPNQFQMEESEDETTNVENDLCQSSLSTTEQVEIVTATTHPNTANEPRPSTSGGPTHGSTIETESSLSAEKLKRTRKRKQDSSSWEKNIDIRKRKLGEQYMGRKKLGNKTIRIQKEPRKIGTTCTSKKCLTSTSRKCNEFTEEARSKIFSNFWKNMDWAQRKVYISTLVDKVAVKRRRGNTGVADSRRNSTVQYHLKTNDVRFPVCKTMFLNTLGLSEWSVLDWLKKSTSDGMHKSPVLHPQVRKRQKQTEVDYLKNFLLELPKMPSHYCRARTSKLYLEPLFKSKVEVYRVYCKKCVEEGVGKLSNATFAAEFDKLNIGLFQPKKDLCDTCIMFEAGNITEEEWKAHRTKKDEARTEMNNDTERAKVSEGKYKVSTMDVEAVLLSPKLNASALYYKTKLLVHNFSIFDNATHDVRCYLWHEGEGGITADEFASCIIHYLNKTVTVQCEEVVLWSDGCGYQNRNCYLSNALVQFAVEKKVVVTQKILEKGHTQMICDSVHSMVERKVKRANINVPADYANIVAAARVDPSPYSVEYIDHTFFKKYSALQAYSSIRPGTKAGDPTVTDLRAIKYNIDGSIQYKLVLSEEWKLLPRRLVKLSLEPPPSLYKGRIKIKMSK